jgi:integrase
MRGGAFGELAAHWRRTNFATWLFQPAVTGWYPRKGHLLVRPVPVLCDPWPGIPVRGRNVAGRADACCLPLASGLTPHGLRHTHKTLMERRTPGKLMDERMGHEDGSGAGPVLACHGRDATAAPRRSDRRVGGSLGRAAAMVPGSPVAVLDRLLRTGAG